MRDDGVVTAWSQTGMSVLPWVHLAATTSIQGSKAVLQIAGSLTWRASWYDGIWWLEPPLRGSCPSVLSSLMDWHYHVFVSIFTISIWWMNDWSDLWCPEGLKRMTNLTHQISNKKEEHSLDSCQLGTCRGELLSLGVHLLNINNSTEYHIRQAQCETVRPQRKETKTRSPHNHVYAQTTHEHDAKHKNGWASGLPATSCACCF